MSEAKRFGFTGNAVDLFRASVGLAGRKLGKPICRLPPDDPEDAFAPRVQIRKSRVTSALRWSTLSRKAGTRSAPDAERSQDGFQQRKLKQASGETKRRGSHVGSQKRHHRRAAAGARRSLRSSAQSLAIIETYDQARVDRLCQAVAWQSPTRRRSPASSTWASRNRGFGDKVSRMGKRLKIRGVLRDALRQKSVGVIEETAREGHRQIRQARRASSPASCRPPIPI